MHSLSRIWRTRTLIFRHLFIFQPSSGDAAKIMAQRRRHFHTAVVCKLAFIRQQQSTHIHSWCAWCTNLLCHPEVLKTLDIMWKCIVNKEEGWCVFASSTTINSHFFTLNVHDARTTMSPWSFKEVMNIMWKCILNKEEVWRVLKQISRDSNNQHDFTLDVHSFSRTLS